MSRELPQSVKDDVASNKINWAVLLELMFDGNPARVWSGTGTLNWNGHDWLGLGSMGSLSGVTEATDLSDALIEATLSSVPMAGMPDLFDEVLSNEPVGRPFSLYLAFLNDDGQVASADNVVTLTAGFIDSVNVSDGDTGVIKLQLASEAALLARNTVYRLDDQHQRHLFPGDEGLEYVTNIEQEITWGSGQTNSFPPQKSGGGKGGAYDGRLLDY